MEQVLLVIQVIIAVGLIGMVLIQRSESDGFGLGGGSGNNLMSGRSAANAMTRFTAILATLFIVNSLALAVLAARGHKSSIVDTIEASSPAVPSVPLAGASDKKADEKVKPEEKAAPKVPTEGEVKPAAEKAAAKKPAKKAAESSEEDPNDANE